MDRNRASASFRHGLATIAVSASLFLAGCGQQAAASAPAAVDATPVAPTVQATPVATTSVAIQNFRFGPQAIAVHVGDKVTWTNHDVEQHTATAKDKSFDSDVIDNNKSYSFTFTKAGTYSYSCLIHPEMIGTVTVTP